MRLLHIFDLKCCRAFIRCTVRRGANHRKPDFFFEYRGKVKTYFLARPVAMASRVFRFASGGRRVAQ
jgi:hypothetical protein